MNEQVKLYLGLFNRVKEQPKILVHEILVRESRNDYKTLKHLGKYTYTYSHGKTIITNWFMKREFS
jgi:hypothetical protein